MAVSKTSLCNKALTLCGSAPITNIADDTQAARVLNRVYEISRKAVLTETRWTFATTRASLSLSADVMPFYHSGEQYVYVRPAHALRIFSTSDPYAVWREEGDYILSDTQNLGITFVYDHDDPSKYPSYFTEAFIDKLCSDISFMIINSASKAEAFLKKYISVSLPCAMSINAMTGTQQVPIDDEWERAKTTSGRPDRSYGG